MRTGLTLALALTLIPTAALAHPGAESHEWVHGFAHALGFPDVPLPYIAIGLAGAVIVLGAGIALLTRLNRGRAEARRIT